MQQRARRIAGRVGTGQLRPLHGKVSSKRARQAARRGHRRPPSVRVRRPGIAARRARIKPTAAGGRHQAPARSAGFDTADPSRPPPAWSRAWEVIATTARELNASWSCLTNACPTAMLTTHAQPRIRWNRVMTTLNLYEAKTQLSKLVDRAAAGEEIVIAKAGKPMARLVPLEPRRPRKSGFSRARSGWRTTSTKPRRRSSAISRTARSSHRTRTTGRHDRRPVAPGHACSALVDGGRSEASDDLDATIRSAATVFVSVATAWEIAIKISAGKLTLAMPLGDIVDEAGFDLLPITLEHTTEVAKAVATSPPRPVRSDAGGPGASRAADVDHAGSQALGLRRRDHPSVIPLNTAVALMKAATTRANLA